MVDEIFEKVIRHPVRQFLLFKILYRRQVVIRKLRHCYKGRHIYHQIDVIEATELRNSPGEKLVNSENETKHFKLIKWIKGGENKRGKDWWSTYQYQLGVCGSCEEEKGSHLAGGHRVNKSDKDD